MARCRLSQQWKPGTPVRAYRRAPGDVEPSGPAISEALADDEGVATFEELEPAQAIFAVGETPQYGELVVETSAEPLATKTVTVVEER